MSKFLLLNFKDFGLNQDITKTIQSRALMCVCCLAKDVQYISLVNCNHSAFLAKFLQHVELKPVYQVVCFRCHAILKHIQAFHEQVEASFKLLMSGKTTDNLKPKTANLSCIKTVDILLPQIDQEMLRTDAITETKVDDTELAKKRLTNIQTGLAILKRNIDSLGVISTGIEILKTIKSEQGNVSAPDDVKEEPLMSVKAEDMETPNQSSVVKIEVIEPPECETENKPELPEVKPVSNVDSLVKMEIELGKEIITLTEDNQDRPSVIETVTMTKEEFLMEKCDRLVSPGFARYKHRCKDCVLGFIYEENLVDHIARKHGPKVGSVTCELCLQTVYPAGSISAHMHQHYTRHKCSVCRRLFLMHDEALAHYRRTHSRDKVYACKSCPFTTLEKKNKSAQRQKEYRQRKRLEKQGEKKKCKTNAQRQQEFRQKQKQMQQSEALMLARKKQAADRAKRYRSKLKSKKQCAVLDSLSSKEDNSLNKKESDELSGTKETLCQIQMQNHIV